MYTWQIKSHILNLGQNILYIQIKCPILNLTMRKMWQSNPRQAEGSFLLSNFKLDIFICVCKIFWPKFSIVTRSVYILFVPVYNILHKRFKFGHLTLTIGWICCGNLIVDLNFSYRQTHFKFNKVLAFHNRAYLQCVPNFARPQSNFAWDGFGCVTDVWHVTGLAQLPPPPNWPCVT
jgi:hypothetical protein